uniref:Uncharacterized protein n=1 Tax=Branchiostoma floridae TaxID=7739 RepID=C3ZJR4_BRAFL|eukprot:XP_002591188.1 hypothetical protein BRAFLDRAFT_105390 [Branchiostoma floridae]
MTSNSNGCEAKGSDGENNLQMSEKNRETKKARLCQFESDSDTERLEASEAYCLDASGERDVASISPNRAWYDGSQEFEYDDISDITTPRSSSHTWDKHESIFGVTLKGDERNEQVTDQDYEGDYSSDYEDDVFIVKDAEMGEVILSTSAQEAVSTNSKENCDTGDKAAFLNIGNFAKQKGRTKFKPVGRHPRSWSVEGEPSHSPNFYLEPLESPESPTSPTDRGQREVESPFASKRTPHDSQFDWSK